MERKARLRTTLAFTHAYHKGAKALKSARLWSWSTTKVNVTLRTTGLVPTVREEAKKWQAGYIAGKHGGRSIPQWNAYVESGASREERRQRLEEVPVLVRDVVRRHVETVFALAARRRPAACAAAGPSQ
jgi:hypothetical protein